MDTLHLSADPDGLRLAAQLLQDGALVAFPTETVYGLGADASDDTAVARIYQAKGRPSFNPLIVHVADLEQARDYAVFSPEAERLAQAFWPGALTLILPLKPGAALSSLVTAGLPDVAIRIPQSPVARDLLRAFGGALAAPSANASGRVSPTTAAHVLDAQGGGLGGRIEAVLDGGPCAVGLESTILRPGEDGRDGHSARILRPGGIPVEAIEAALGHPLMSEAPVAADAPAAPGQLASHYAPGAALRMDATTVRADEILLGFGARSGQDAALINLSPAGDLLEAAANLFDMLRRMDEAAQRSGAAIAVAPVPDRGLGRAINDRLRRAAAPRPSGDDAPA